MSNEQIKKDLLIQRAFLKKELDQLRLIAEVTGTNQEKEIDKRFHLQPYYQVFSSKFGFIPDASILDLLFNMGPESQLVLYDRI